ncbi:MAG: hypothetical protein ACREAB_17990 [Blastocatellia bacterium]
MAEETKTEEAKAEEIQLVKMTRAIPAIPDGPSTADVHPDEVENWRKHGWAIAEAAPTQELKSPEVDQNQKPKSGKNK